MYLYLIEKKSQQRPSRCYKNDFSNKYSSFELFGVGMTIAHSLKTCDICDIVLCDKTAHFRVAFYCGQPKVRLCNNHAV